MTAAAQSYPPRPYQEILDAEIDLAWLLCRRVLMQLPTGGGKTVVFARQAQKFTSQNLPVLVIAHREELLLQAQQKLESITGHAVGIIKFGYPYNKDCLIQVASVQSLINREKPEAALVVVDEAHHITSQTYQSILEYYPDAKILGCTATPIRTDGQNLKTCFDKLICGPSVRELIDAGYLSEYTLFVAKKVVDTSKVKSLAGDFAIGQLSKEVSAQIEPVDIVAEWIEKLQGRKTIVFAVDIARSLEYRNWFLQTGIPAAHLDYDTPKDERKRILKQFRSGQILVLCNCGIVSEGFDVPDIEAVQFVRPTRSLIVWLQSLGRGFRPKPSNKELIIIDHTTTWSQAGFGPPDNPRNWHLDFIQPQQLEYLECSNCGFVFLDTFKDVQSCNCPKCGTELLLTKGNRSKRGERWLNPNEIELEIRVKSSYRGRFLIDELAKEKEQNNYSLDWLIDNFVQQMDAEQQGLSVGELRYIEERLGLEKGWAWSNYRLKGRASIYKQSKDVGNQSSNIDGICEFVNYHGLSADWAVGSFANSSSRANWATFSDWVYLAKKLGIPDIDIEGKSSNDWALSNFYTYRTIYVSQKKSEIERRQFIRNLASIKGVGFIQNVRKLRKRFSNFNSFINQIIATSDVAKFNYSQWAFIEEVGNRRSLIPEEDWAKAQYLKYRKK